MHREDKEDSVFIETKVESKKPVTIWDHATNQRIEIPEKFIRFYEEIDKICKEYDYSISHEDQHGGFIIEKYNTSNLLWLKEAAAGESLNIKK